MSSEKYIGMDVHLEQADPGYKCEGAGDGDEALAKAKASKPDVVVLDMLMPRMSGLAAARLISDRLPATKILLHTVHGSDLLSANASRYGVFRVVDKTDGNNLLFANWFTSIRWDDECNGDVRQSS